MQWQRGTFTVDTDRRRLDRDAIARWIGGSYWASDRPVDRIHASWDAAALVCGLYNAEQQIGCARAVTDLISVAYLADVYIEPAYRGQGLGTWMVGCLVDHPDLAPGVRWLLHTRDAHALYRRLGFTEPGNRLMERPRSGN